MKLPLFRLSIICFLLGISIPITSQTVTVSKEISVKSDYAYDLFNMNNGNILMYRDKGSDQKFEVFDSDLQFLYEQRITLESFRDTRIVEIIGTDSLVTIYYTFQFKQGSVLKCKNFLPDGTPRDTLTLATDDGDLFKKAMGSVVSEDHSKLVIYRYFDKNLHVFIIDNRNKEVLQYSLLDKNNYELKDGIKDVAISNDGIVWLRMNSEFDSGHENNQLVFYNIPLGAEPNLIKIDFKDYFSPRMILKFDNHNKNIALAGLLELDENESDAYFVFRGPQIMSSTNLEIIPIPISDQMLYLANGKPDKPEEVIKDYYIKDFFFREDGGVLLIFEYEKVVYRRANYAGTRFYGDNLLGYSNMTDHYHENLILINLNPDLTQNWEKLLFKKQYSQDDDGYFSSICTFITPSRLRFLYNDEIKNFSTVSEYVLDPFGNVERNSVLSTEYQDLRLRINDALQLNNSEILVPSEKSGKLNLVKISYH
ncbi:MAG: hypothetical protein R2766_02490 [Saprospiraceae bacterium]